MQSTKYSKFQWRSYKYLPLDITIRQLKPFPPTHVPSIHLILAFNLHSVTSFIPLFLGGGVFASNILFAPSFKKYVNNVTVLFANC